MKEEEHGPLLGTLTSLVPHGRPGSIKRITVVMFQEALLLPKPPLGRELLKKEAKTAKQSAVGAGTRLSSIWTS